MKYIVDDVFPHIKYDIVEALVLPKLCSVIFGDYSRRPAS